MSSVVELIIERSITRSDEVPGTWKFVCFTSRNTSRVFMWQATVPTLAYAAKSMKHSLPRFLPTVSFLDVRDRIMIGAQASLNTRRS